MRDAFRDVLEFRRVMGLRIGGTPADIPRRSCYLHDDLISEEYYELRLAMFAGDLAGVADGAIDLIYVVLGALAEYGIDPVPVWSAVQAANLAKVGGSVRADGKILKGPNWRPPDVAGILAAQAPIDITST